MKLKMKKILTLFVLMITLTVAGTLTLHAQQVRQLKVYLKGGVVDTLRLVYGTLYHSHSLTWTTFVRINIPR